jgi:hypothetical protein
MILKRRLGKLLKLIRFIQDKMSYRERIRYVPYDMAIREAERLVREIKGIRKV